MQIQKIYIAAATYKLQIESICSRSRRTNYKEYNEDMWNTDNFQQPPWNTSNQNLYKILGLFRILTFVEHVGNKMINRANGWLTAHIIIMSFPQKNRVHWLNIILYVFVNSTPHHTYTRYEHMKCGCVFILVFFICIEIYIPQSVINLFTIHVCRLQFETERGELMLQIYKYAENSPFLELN